MEGREVRKSKLGRERKGQERTGKEGEGGGGGKEKEGDGKGRKGKGGKLERVEGGTEGKKAGRKERSLRHR